MLSLQVVRLVEMLVDVSSLGLDRMHFVLEYFSIAPPGAVSSYVRVFKIEDGASINNEQVQTAKRLAAEDVPIYYSRRESKDAI